MRPAVRHLKWQSHALAGVPRIASDGRTILGSGSRLIKLVAGLLGLSFTERYTLCNGDVLVSVSRVTVKALCADECQDGVTEGRDGDFGWNFDKDVFFPLRSVNKVANVKWDIGVTIGAILMEDNISPGLLRIDVMTLAFQCGIGKFPLYRWDI